MHKITTLILVLLFLALSGCDKKEKTDDIPIQDCNTSSSDKNNSSVCLTHLGKDTFTLRNDNNTSYKVQVFQNSIKMTPSPKPIVLLSFFASWCPPCINSIDSFNDIEEKYSDKVFITTALVHDAMEEKPYAAFLKKHHIKYFVSQHPDNDPFATLVAKTLKLPKNFSIPLSILYVNGEYFTHYEGAIPAEMIEFDIQQAIESIN